MTNYIKKIKYFRKLCQMLQMILNNNSMVADFVFIGTIENGKRGVFVKGVDSSNIRKFKKFYSTQDIHYYFNELNKRLERK